MAIKIRLARGGSKKRPFYKVVAADSRMPRDGRFIEKLGTYNPLLPKDHPERVKLNVERIQEWVGKGAQLSDRISRILEKLSVIPAKSRNNPKKGLKHKATEEREAAKSEKTTPTNDQSTSEHQSKKMESENEEKQDDTEKQSFSDDDGANASEEKEAESISSPEEKQEEDVKEHEEDKDSNPTSEETGEDTITEEKKPDK